MFRIADGGPPLVREALLACGESNTVERRSRTRLATPAPPCSAVARPPAQDDLILSLLHRAASPSSPHDAAPRQRVGDAGWVELDREAEPEGDYNLWWKSSRFKPSELEDARTHGARRINHFPKSGVITRKDSLLRAMRRMRSTHGAIYSFTPRGFLLPTEYTKFVKAFAAQGAHPLPLRTRVRTSSRRPLGALPRAAAGQRRRACGSASRRI